LNEVKKNIEIKKTKRMNQRANINF